MELEVEKKKIEQMKLHQTMGMSHRQMLHKRKKERMKQMQKRMELEKDEPIYFLCSPRYDDKSSSSMFWYVIENRDYVPPEDENENEIAEFTKKGVIEVVSFSKTDRIRALRLPPPPPFLSDPTYITSLAFSNSYLYLLGGADSIVGPHNIIRYIDILHQKNGWRMGRTFPSYTPQSICNVATSNNGSIVLETIGFSHTKQLLWLSSPSSIWEKLPEPSNTNLAVNTTQILALTNTHLFCIMGSKFKRTIYGVFFTFADRKWCVFDKNSFQGLWSQGAVFFDNYLITYGTTTAYSMKKRPYLHVFDLKACKWLPPHPCNLKNAFPPSEPTQSPFLFQVGPKKLAVVWDRVVFDSMTSLPKFYEIYSTKFEICKSSSTNQPPVYAKVFSHGIYRVGGPLVSCGAWNYVGEGDKETLEKRRNKLVELVAEDSWMSFLL